MSSSFFVYILTPVRAPLRMAKTYVGFTTYPAHRIRQHNGDITGGARRTARCRPWEFVAVVAGLPDKITAYQLEWALQHPKRGLKTRSEMALMRGRKGLGKVGSVRRKLHELRLILGLCQTWSGLPLSIHFRSREFMEIGADFMAFPSHFQLAIGGWDALGSRKKSVVVDEEDVEELENDKRGSNRSHLAPVTSVGSVVDQSEFQSYISGDTDDDNDEVIEDDYNEEAVDDDYDVQSVHSVVNLISPCAPLRSTRKHPVDSPTDLTLAFSPPSPPSLRERKMLRFHSQSSHDEADEDLLTIRVKL